MPYNAIQGDQANLRQDGTAPYCAMMQVAAEDTYDDYVICRGFDPRILRFIDYAEGDPNKPGISVAKPFGNRVAGRYEIAEVYPALLPTQGNDEFSGFRQTVYTPPSPVAVEWRVGQNPGTVTGGGLEGGQPEDLTDAIEILYDHNGKVVNWLLLDSRGGTEFYVYEHTASLSIGTPSTGVVDVYNKDDESTLIEAGAPWVGNVSIFDSQTIGDRGTCVKIGDTYYGINLLDSGLP